MSTYLADAIRRVAADPSRDALRKLPALAAQVERLEVSLNEQVEQARTDAHNVALAMKRFGLWEKL